MLNHKTVRDQAANKGAERVAKLARGWNRHVCPAAIVHPRRIVNADFGPVAIWAFERVSDPIPVFRPKTQDEWIGAHKIVVPTGTQEPRHLRKDHLRVRDKP